MRDILADFPTPYIDAQTLLIELKDYSNPRDWIARQVKKKILIRIKNGFFLIAARFKKGNDFPFEQLANLLYGPSYISLEWALSFYQFIPERVTAVTSMTLAKSKEFSTPIGLFTFHYMNKKRYSVGVVRREIPGQFGGFLIATPEKALADWVFLTCKGLNRSELLVDLLDSKRIEKDKLKSLDLDLMEQITEMYGSDTIHTLFEVLKKL